jgi:alanine dehydrogenase
MIIGVPKETKVHEYRVALLPFGAEALTQAGHKVLFQKGAADGAGLSDDDYAKFGAELVDDPAEIFAKSDMILKVKEPQPNEIKMLRENQILFTYLHLAADEELTKGLQKSGCSAVAYETLTARNGTLPLLTPMSEIAGRMSVQQGAIFLEKANGGRGVLLGGIPGVEPAHVLVLGGGVVGTNAAKVAAGMGAQVIVVDRDFERMRYLNDILPENVVTIYSTRQAILEKLPRVDLVIGAVLLPGARTPRLIQREDLKLMSPGTVLVDVAIDQGGCFETSKATTHTEPTFEVDGVIHYCVGNMPGGVARTSTFGLCNSTFPWVMKLAQQGIEKAAETSPAVATGLNVYKGQIVYRAVSETFGLPFDDRFERFYWK